MKKDYILKTNTYGNVTAYTDDGNVLLPANWVKSQLTVTQLRKLEIPTYKACIGFEEKYIGTVADVYAHYLEMKYKYRDMEDSEKEAEIVIGIVKAYFIANTTE